MITWVILFVCVLALSCIRGFWGNLFSSFVYVFLFLNVDKVFIVNRLINFSYILLYYNKCSFYLYSKIVKSFFYKSCLDCSLLDNYSQLYFNGACLPEIIILYCFVSYFFFIIIKVLFFYSSNKLTLMLKQYCRNKFKNLSFLDKSFILGDLFFLYEVFILLNFLLISSLFTINSYLFIYLVSLQLFLDYLPTYFKWSCKIVLKKKILFETAKQSCHEVCNNLIKFLIFFI